MDFSDLRSDPPSQTWLDRPGTVQLEGVVGSRAYGLAHDGSDENRLGVFLAPSHEFFGLSPVTETVANPWVDETLHELGKTCRLLLKVNPTFTELLWLPSYLIRTAVGSELIELREAFLSAPYCRNAFFGYATSQRAKLREGGDPERAAKDARHLARLLISGFGLWSTGRLQVQVDAPEWLRGFGDRVAGGDLQAADDLLGTYEKLFDTTKTALPTQPDRVRVEAWLCDVRVRSLDGRSWARPDTLADVVHSR